MDSRVTNVYKLLGNDGLHTIYDGTDVLLTVESDKLIEKLYANVQAVLNVEGRRQVHDYINNNPSKAIHVKDKSLKGSIDVLLQPLLRLLLDSGRFVSTSCCSGRIVIFENNTSHSRDTNLYGRCGRILYSSHSHVDVEEDLENIKKIVTHQFHKKDKCYMKDSPEVHHSSDSLHDDNYSADCTSPKFQNITLGGDAGSSGTIPSIASELDRAPCSGNYTPITDAGASTIVLNDVLLKFEPFLIHTECASIDDAKDLLQLCRECGLKQSGIISISKRVILAIRGISVLEAPILLRYYTNIYDDYGNVRDQHLQYHKWLVDDFYFRLLINSCNNKLTANFKQIIKFYWMSYHFLLHAPSKIFNGYRTDLTKDIIAYINGESRQSEGIPSSAEFNTQFPSVSPFSTSIHKGITPLRLLGITPDGKAGSSTASGNKNSAMQSKKLGMSTDTAVARFPHQSTPLDTCRLLLNVQGIYEDDSLLTSLHRCNPAVAGNDHYLCVFGGRIRSKKNTVAVYDLGECERCFSLYDIPADGPLPLEHSSMISDGRGNFILFGGRFGMSRITNEVWVFQVCLKNWIKCSCEGVRPRERYRHSMCLNDDSSFVRFYVLGGVFSAQPVEDGLLNDIWEGIIDYSIDFTGKIVSARVRWTCLSSRVTPGKGVCSGTLGYSKSLNSLFLVGGYTRFEEISHHLPIFMNSIRTFNLSSQECGNIEVNSVNQPLLRISHSMARVAEDEYLVIGGITASTILNDVWYLNLKFKLWYFIGLLPDINISVKLGAYYVNETNELILIGGGLSMIVFPTYYNNPLSVTFSLKEISKKTTKYIICKSKNSIKKIKNFLEGAGLYDKKRKIIMKDNVLQPDHAKFRTVGSSPYHGIPDHFRGEALVKDTIPDNDFIDGAKENLSTGHAAPPSSLHDDTFGSVLAYVPVVDTADIVLPEDLRQEVIYDDASCVFDLDVISKNLKLGLLELIGEFLIFLNLNESAFPTSYHLIGDALVFPKSGIDEKFISLGSSIIGFLADSLGVSSIAVMDEIQGEKRIPNCKLLYGTGEVKHKENGVYYVFNITKNMFSPGNCSERIRIPKQYFGFNRGERSEIKCTPPTAEDSQLSHTHNKVDVTGYSITSDTIPGNFAEEDKTSTGERVVLSHVEPSGEVLVDFFCGIGYFILPLLKYTDKDQIRVVFACDINLDAVKYLELGLKENGVDDSRVITHVGDASKFGVDFGFEFVNSANRILLGLLPSSELAWNSALLALDSVNGGILHVHGVHETKYTVNKTITHINTTDSMEYAANLDTPSVGASSAGDASQGSCTDGADQIPASLSRIASPEATNLAEGSIEYGSGRDDAPPSEFRRLWREDCRRCDYGQYVLRKFHALCKGMEKFNSRPWRLSILQVVMVKKYSPHKYHFVVDLEIKPVVSQC